MILRFLSLMTEGSHWLKRWPGKRSMFEGKMINSVLNMLCLMSLWDSDETSRRHLKLESWSSGKLFGLNIWVKEPSTSLHRDSPLIREDALGQSFIYQKNLMKREKEKFTKGPCTHSAWSIIHLCLSDLKGPLEAMRPNALYRWGDWVPRRGKWPITPSSSSITH